MMDLVLVFLLLVSDAHFSRLAGFVRRGSEHGADSEVVGTCSNCLLRLLYRGGTDADDRVLGEKLPGYLNSCEQSEYDE